MKNTKYTFERGFLPEYDPLERLPPQFDDWEKAAKNLPKLLLSDHFHQHILQLPPFPVDALQSIGEIERAMQLFSYLGHAFVWTAKTPPRVLPKALAKPWYYISKKLDRPPVLSYASYALHNWRRIDPKGPVALGNITLIQNFLGGIDEEWFILVHVAIEARAADAVRNTLVAVQEAQTKNIHGVLKALQDIYASMLEICKTLARMPEHCDPYIYFTRVRPYIHGWKNHPAYPEGLIYEAVAEYENKPQQFRGETGAQSTIIPMLDALLGISHEQDELYHYLQEMKLYMPREHREFLSYIEENSIRSFVAANTTLHEVYNGCIDLIDRFRSIHFGFAANYIQKQHEKSQGNPNAVGTGGTPFMQYLKKHQSETAKHKF